MKKVLFLTIFMFIMTLNIGVVNAVACDDEDMARLRGLAEGVSYNAKFIGDTGTAESMQDYEVNFIGLTNEIYVGDIYRTFSIYNDSEKRIIQSGETDLEIFSKNCNHVRIKTITLKLPKYNTYASLAECSSEENKNLYVCDPWYSGKITKEEFLDAVVDDGDIYETENSSKINLLKNKYVLFGLVVIVISLIVVIIIRNKRNVLN